MAENWTCPYCGTFTTINNGDRTQSQAILNSRSKHEEMQALITSTSCPNPNCKEMTVDLYFYDLIARGAQFVRGDRMHYKRIWPEGKIHPLPEIIPESIRKTYREAVLVREISGAASAALSRRCLQGIVRDFFDIPLNKRGELGAELAHVKDRIDPEIWEDIQAVRSVGDIGAHMDKNVDYLVDVDPEEATLLTKLIETLFKVWYIDRENRKTVSESLRELVETKRKQQKAAKAAMNPTKTASDKPNG